MAVTSTYPGRGDRHALGVDESDPHRVRVRRVHRRTLTGVATKALLTGAALIVLGIVVTILSDSGSVTSLIPAFVGVVFVAIGVAARAKPDLNHHLMHAAAAVSLLAILGSLGSIIGRGSSGWALFAQIATVIIVAAFLQQAVMSFIAARKAREAEAA